MSTLKKHLSNEKLQRLNQAWQYLTPIQRVSIFIRAIWCSLPSVITLIERIQHRFNQWIIYQLYPAHWINIIPFSPREKG